MSREGECVECPWCEHEHDFQDALIDGWNGGDEECESCGNPFTVDVDYTVMLHSSRAERYRCPRCERERVCSPASRPLCFACHERMEPAAPDWIVELEPDVFLADGEGDPPRTMFPLLARVFPSCAEATAAIEEARRFRPFERAAVVGRTGRRE